MRTGFVIILKRRERKQLKSQGNVFNKRASSWRTKRFSTDIHRRINNLRTCWESEALYTCLFLVRNRQECLAIALKSGRETRRKGHSWNYSRRLRRVHWASTSTDVPPSSLNADCVMCDSLWPSPDKSAILFSVGVQLYFESQLPKPSGYHVRHNILHPSFAF